MDGYKLLCDYSVLQTQEDIFFDTQKPYTSKSVKFNEGHSKSEIFWMAHWIWWQLRSPLWIITHHILLLWASTPLKTRLWIPSFQSSMFLCYGPKNLCLSKKLLTGIPAHEGRWRVRQFQNAKLKCKWERGIWQGAAGSNSCVMSSVGPCKSGWRCLLDWFCRILTTGHTPRLKTIEMEQLPLLVFPFSVVLKNFLT